MHNKFATAKFPKSKSVVQKSWSSLETDFLALSRTDVPANFDQHTNYQEFFLSGPFKTMIHCAVPTSNITFNTILEIINNVHPSVPNWDTNPR